MRVAKPMSIAIKNLLGAPRALALAAALLAAAACPAPALAAAPQVRTQGPGYYRMMLGDFEVTALLDGTHVFPVETVMTGVSREAVARDLARADLALPLQGSINAYLINTGDKLILIDSGAGALYGDCCGHLLANLRAAGYQPEQVDEVLLTHLHKDHVGGIVVDGKMAFPNAVLRTSQAEADYWLTLANKARAPAFLASFFDAAAAALAPYLAAGRFQPIAADGQLEAGVGSLAAPGHTPGHTAYFVSSGGHTLLVWGDIVHVAAIQLQDTQATVSYDSIPASARQWRDTLLARAASQQLVVGAAHIAFPGLGHLRRDGASYDWIPLNYDADPGKNAAPAPAR